MDLLEDTLNFSSTDEQKAKDNKRAFSMALVVLKEDFLTDVTTKFLRGFVKAKTEKAKSNRVNYMIKEIGLNKATFHNYYKEVSPNMVIRENDEIKLYTRKYINGQEVISERVIKITSHDNRGIKAFCKVGVFSSKWKSVSYNQVLI